MSESETEWKTLRVPKRAYDRAKNQKEEYNRTWGEQIVRPDGESKTEWTEDEIREIVKEELDTSVYNTKRK